MPDSRLFLTNGSNHHHAFNIRMRCFLSSPESESLSVAQPSEHNASYDPLIGLRRNGAVNFSEGREIFFSVSLGNDTPCDSLCVHVWTKMESSF